MSDAETLQDRAVKNATAEGAGLEDLEFLDELHVHIDDFRPPADPEKWQTIYNLTIGAPCPRCGTTIGILVARREEIEDVVDVWMRSYPVSQTDGWAEGYDAPVYIYCDNPICRYQKVGEWSDVHPRIDSWRGDAPLWADRITGGEA